MLKNELEILTTVFASKNGVSVAAHKAKLPDFSKVVLDGCDRAMQAWAVAAFSDHPNESLIRYFDYHFKFLNGLIAEHADDPLRDPLNELCKLMDHLLLFYGSFISCGLLITTRYLGYRCRLWGAKYKEFEDRFSILNNDKDLLDCLSVCLSPFYCSSPGEPLKLSALFYREALLNELAGRRYHADLMTTECLISVLISYNFNHIRFLAYLRKRTIRGLSGVANSSFSVYFCEQGNEIPAIDTAGGRCYDPDWPHIATMYKDWLNDYAALLEITSGKNAEMVVQKVPLAISVKQLACLIRVFYESGMYGNTTLTAIFDHAATVFTTKRQEHISAESISNAYYELPQSSALKINRMLGKAMDFLKPYCFPGEAATGATFLSLSKNLPAPRTTRD
ncbi:hypothetical protein AAFN85_13565 [Mucilaginibacter sp. CAU 1740]|uniref:hypothetical protein n=1 Tax=Mucilaginibacter sp. CAU 1740 TaxID=3140365 RepID=UPI00325B0024